MQNNDVDYIICPTCVKTNKRKLYHTGLIIIDLTPASYPFQAAYVFDTDEEKHSFIYDRLDERSKQVITEKTAPNKIYINYPLAGQSYNAQVTSFQNDTICDDLTSFQLLIAHGMNEVHPTQFYECVRAVTTMPNDDAKGGVCEFFKGRTFIRWEDLESLNKHGSEHMVYNGWHEMEVAMRDMDSYGKYEMFAYYLSRYAEQNKDMMCSWGKEN